MARGLRLGHSHTIGLLVPDVHNPFFVDVLRGVEQEVAERDYYLSFTTSNWDAEREQRCLVSLFQQRLDGLIILPTFADTLTEELKLLSERAQPAVFFANMEGEKKVDWIATDTRRGAEALLDHLFSLGHRRISYINGLGRRDIDKEEHRLAVYREKMATWGLPLDEQWVQHCGHQMEDGYEAAKKLLELAPRPTVIWAINDVLATGALRAIHERGLRVPEDISLASFDDTYLAQQLYPPLTSVRMFPEQVGRRATQMLFHRIQHPEGEPIQEIFPTELIVRQSTAAPKPGASPSQ
jgi:DNA-binding LacI/PurR family transcriptional regulator